MDFTTILTTTQSGVAQGLMWALLTIGVYITYRLLDFADLTIEGTFPLGAAVTVVLINAGVNPFVAVLAAMLIGSLAGLVTGIFNTVFKIPAILSGILTMIALYSVNIRIMDGRATVTIMNDSVKNIMSRLLDKLLNGVLGLDIMLKSNTVSIVVGVIVSIILVALLYIFFGTEIGCAIRATGSNAAMARAMGVHTGRMTILGLMISNALIALSGSLIAQFDYGSALVTMGQGTIVIGLASVIIGEVLFIHKDRSFWFKLVAIVLGAIIYRTIIAFAMRVSWLDTTDLKLITAIVVALALALPVIKNFFAVRRARRANDKKFAQMGGNEDA